MQHTHMAKRRTDTAYDIKNKKALAAPYVFQYAAKYPEAYHIGSDVHHGHIIILRTAMHKHMGNKLPYTKQVRLPVVQAQVIGQVYMQRRMPQHILRDHHQHIDDDDIFYHGWYRLESAGIEISHKYACSVVIGAAARH
jgi:hypothetical protein